MGYNSFSVVSICVLVASDQKYEILDWFLKQKLKFSNFLSRIH